MPLRKCNKCGKVICEGKAQFFIEPYHSMCNYCRDQALLAEGKKPGDAKAKNG